MSKQNFEVKIDNLDVNRKSKPAVASHSKSVIHKRASNILLNNKFPFIVTEAYKTIRANLSFVLSSNKCNKIIITSSTEQEGKSTTVSNLAITMAQTNSKVLIIDADMRKPTQHKNLSQNNINGLSNVLIGDCDFATAIKTIIPKSLYLLTAGTLPPNPAELMASDSMSDLLEFVSKNYDFVIIDTPPVNVISDAKGIMKEDVGVVIVTHSKSTTCEELAKTVENINLTPAKILGTIVTSVDYGKSSKNYGYKNYKYQYK